MDSRLEQLRARGIYIGTSSWKYEGWKNLIYLRPYRSKKEFNDTCLEEYAEHFTAVGVDQTYYAWPTAPLFERYVRQTPPEFRFGLKATERATVFRFPNLKRYGKEAGRANPDFLSPAPFEDNFLAPLQGVSDRLAPIMFEFSQFYPGMLESGKEFVDRMHRFLEAVTRHREFRFGVEIRNGNWLKAPYFEMLSATGVGHVFSSWTRMPSIGEQLRAAEGFRLPFLLSRVLLKPGTRYEDAVERFSPYDEIKEVQSEVRDDASRLIERALDLGIPAYVFVNNRCEGCAPLTIAAILDRMKR